MIDESYRRKEANINDSFKFRRRCLYRRNASPPRPSARGGKGADARLSEVLSYALDGYAYETATEISAFEDYVNRWRRLEKTQNRKNPVQGRILFAVPLGTSGINLELYRLIRFLREHPDFLNGFVGGLLVDSENDLYSKSAAKDLVFAANCAGCAFVGRPLVEGTRTLSNYTIVSNNLGTDLMGAYRESAAGLVKEVLGTDCVRKKCPKVLVLHASSHKTSNTYAIWNRVKEQLPEMEIREIGLRNGTLSDCAGARTRCACILASREAASTAE